MLQNRSYAALVRPRTDPGMSATAGSRRRIWVNPPATWKTLIPNPQAINKITNRIVKILMNPLRDVSSTTYKNHSGYALGVSEQSGS